MGSPPPVNFPQPLGAGAGASVSLDFPPSPTASICGFSLGIPRFKIGFVLPSIALPFVIPYISFKLVCKLPNPVDISAGLNSPFGGGRTFNADPNPDLNDATP